ncbi:hypothetical protein RMSM_02569 [Rhodopirellula maiorica SM1]|uniref:Uncharacterized protein n=1 Tax=Rhodopirellula maiorica SM1 TaxID=1265738 RepID=M5RYR0_9BACT|nr:hypothetical protein RMSM_02569 [Rhodopirellula maiorica SM1]
MIDAIKAVTDQFVFTNPGEVDANAVSGAGAADWMRPECEVQSVWPVQTWTHS